MQQTESTRTSRADRERHEKEGDGGPLLGALLRRCHRAVESHVDRGFREAGLVPPRGAVMQPLGENPAGMRLTDLATRAGITKQSMSELVNAMVDAGYVERVADEDDGRARRLRLTRKGRSVGRIARELVRQVEAEWAEAVGRKRVEELRDTLERVVERCGY